MRESVLQKKVVSYARNKGMLALKIETGNHNGFPDYIFIYKGIFTIIEFKTVDGELSELQKVIIAMLRSVYLCDVHVVDDVNDGYDIIDRFEKKAGGYYAE